jgi:hypothetical protein
MLLRKNAREKIREIARQEYLVACRMHDFHSEKAVISRIARKNSVKRLRDSPQYGGILNALLLSIATKLLTQMIEKWIEDNLSGDEVKSGYQAGEPGYE